MQCWSSARIPDWRPTNVGIVVCAVRNAQRGRRAARATKAEMLSCVALHLASNVALVSCVSVSMWQRNGRAAEAYGDCPTPIHPHLVNLAFVIHYLRFTQPHTHDLRFTCSTQQALRASQGHLLPAKQPILARDQLDFRSALSCLLHPAPSSRQAVRDR